MHLHERSGIKEFTKEHTAGITGESV